MTNHQRFHDRRRGFTLIELLVVISIIGLLSSVVLASLNSARTKSKDAAVKAEARQLVSLFGLSYDDYKSYCQLQETSPTNGIGWIPFTSTCAGSFYGTYASQAQQMCTSILNNAGSWNAPYTVWFGTNGAGGCGVAYSFMVALNNGKWYCVGSSGRSGEYASYNGNPGCHDNP